MISALTFLDAGESSADRSRWSYPLLAEGLQRHDADHLGSRRELFRRMAFNALISNVDDHPRNHALVADAGGWRLSPAYDLVPTPMVSQSGRTLAMRVGAAGRAATRDNLLSESPRFGYPRDEAASVVDDMREIVVGRWYAACRAAGVTPGDCERIRGAFAYPGFDWSVEAGGDGPPSP